MKAFIYLNVILQLLIKSNTRSIKGDMYATYTKIQSKDPFDSFGNQP